MTSRTLPFSLVDVFASTPLAGNSLSVFLLDDELPASAMQRITQEMRQFETIFLRRVGHTATFTARIFTMEEELAFAGHPVIGAAVALHAALFADKDAVNIEFALPGRQLGVASRHQGDHWFAEMDQGTATVMPPLPAAQNEALLKALNLSAADVPAGLPLQVISTGLPYLIVPVRGALARTRITAPGFEALLETVGAKFAYVLDTTAREGRTWDNDGRVEDIATGSAAGPAGAYLVMHGLAQAGETIVLAQGRFLQRPSELHVTVTGTAPLQVKVRGQVCFAGSGELRLPHSVLQAARIPQPVKDTP